MKRLLPQAVGKQPVGKQPRVYLDIRSEYETEASN